MVIISVGLLAAGYDLLPINFERLPLELNNVPWRKRDLAWTYRDQYANRYDRSPTISSYRSRSWRRANIDLYYDTGGGNIFTQTNLKKIQSIENRLTSVPEYSNYCQLAGGSCTSPMSIIRYFDGTFASVDPIFNDTDFNNIPEVLHTALTNTATKSNFQSFLGKSYNITNISASCSITRSMIHIGYPFPGYTEERDYETHIKEFIVAHFEQLLEEIRESTSEFGFLYRSQLLWMDVVMKQAMKDAMCPIGSIIFIFIFILSHTKSLWITGFAVFSIMTSFLGTNLIYRAVLDFQYIGFFHILTVFIVLGIGADDIYVFYDVWRNTGHEDYPTLAHRLSDAYRKSVFSMLFTSITTAVAFFANAISPLLATRSFGVFSGIVIIVNYISVILYFPTVVVMYHKKFEHLRWPCVQFCKKQCKKHCKCCKTDVHSEESNKEVPVLSDVGTVSKHPNYDTVTRSKFTNPNSMPRTPTVMTIIPLMDQDKLDKQFAKGQQTNGDIRQPDNLSSSGMTHSISFKDSKIFNYEKTGVHNLGFVGDEVTETANKAKEETINTMDKVKRYGVAKQKKKKGIFVRFFRDKYFKFVTHPKIRWLILVLMVAVLSFFIYQATRLEPDNEEVSVTMCAGAQKKNSTKNGAPGELI